MLLKYWQRQEVNIEAVPDGIYQTVTVTHKS